MRIALFPRAAAASLTLAGCGLGGPAYQAPPPAVDAVVDMTIGLDFAPADFSIVQGQTVEWRNKSIMGHTVTADPRLARSSASVMLPQGAVPFNSGDVKPGQVYRRTFTLPGVYRYFCIPHEGQGMVGILRVQPRG